MIWLIDTTLRDGEQAPSTAFSRDDKLRIAQMLDRFGIDEIEAGTPAMGEYEQETIRRIVQAGLNARICVWCRAVINDIADAVLTGAEAVHIAFPVSDIQLNALNKDRQWIAATLPLIVAQARTSFRFVSVGAQDAGRASPQQLNDFLSLAAEMQVQRVRIADTVGIMTPLQIAETVKRLTRDFPSLQFDFHAHNDLGMATANAITAWQSGASSLSLTVNGLGERAGNAALEEVAMTLSIIFGLTRYDNTLLTALCNLVATASGRHIPEMKPVCGRWACSHESGIHAMGTIADTVAFQAFNGADAGRNTTEILFGKHSGKNAIVNLLKKNQLPTTPEFVARLLCQIKALAARKQRSLTETDILNELIISQNLHQ